jgi:2-C-methyl-D-erythritol 2,4-cyclodiphosphate synthase
LATTATAFALLGAAALGDVGTQFPDSEAANKGRDSTEMLQIVGKRIQDEGWYVSNIDVTVIAESPRIGAHRAAMAERIAAVLGIAAAQISIKGKTNGGPGLHRGRVN